MNLNCINSLETWGSTHVTPNESYFVAGTTLEAKFIGDGFIAVLYTCAYTMAPPPPAPVPGHLILSAPHYFL